MGRAARSVAGFTTQKLIRGYGAPSDCFGLMEYGHAGSTTLAVTGRVIPGHGEVT
jgi:hypothetical protein